MTDAAHTARTRSSRCPDIVSLSMASGVSAFTGEPFVNLMVNFADGSRKTAGQLTPQQTREHALALLEAAEAAVHDAAMARWMRSQGATQEVAGSAVAAIRAYREDQESEGDPDARS
ncbi:CREG family protein [Actinokineospora sp. UTMC 2448]|uniref:CREG family protein n=1 Tax=Actinokineospora sp. UTMC 2448 TaxID=2268449 RepID=UPI002164B3ED|nr:CREG family protein [Actinokineospora sp. UTMC 2448]